VSVSSLRQVHDAVYAEMEHLQDMKLVRQCYNMQSLRKAMIFFRTRKAMIKPRGREKARALTALPKTRHAHR
jgi:hypothetical protein